MGMLRCGCMVTHLQGVSRTVASLVAKSLLFDATADELTDLQELAEGNTRAVRGGAKLYPFRYTAGV